MKFAPLSAIVLLFSAPAFADQKSADACAVKLPADSAAIYAAAAAQYTPGADLRDIVKGIARGKVMSGELTRDNAKAAAEAAAPCLKQLKQ